MDVKLFQEMLKINKPGEQKGSVLSQPKGFTLIELLIVVGIIGILAAVAIPAYLGMQEGARKGAVIRGAAVAESEIQAWLNSALKGLAAGPRTLGALFEVDTNGDGTIEINGQDVNNYTLGQDLGTANQLCSRYVVARWNLESENSPWVSTAGSLWIAGAAQAGKIACSHVADAISITLTAQDSMGITLHSKVIYAD